MRSLTASPFIALTLIACGGGNSGTPDAPIVVPDAPIPPDAPDPDAPEQQLDFTCMNNPAPTTANAMVVLSGDANGLTLSGVNPQIAPLTDATVDACRDDCAGQNRLDTQTTAANGCPQTGCTFTMDPLATGSVPLDGYIKVTKEPDFRPSNIFPAAPITMDTMGIPALAFGRAAFQTLVAFLGITQTPGNGNVGLVVTDCANTPIGGAQVSVKQNGVDVPNTEVVDASTFDPSLAGTYLVFNIPPGATEVGASINTMPLRAHTITVFADQTSATQIRPGF
jgi:hypothetical protein